MRNYIIKNWILIGILVLATFLRFYKVSEVPVSLFGDELDVGYHAYSIIQTGRDYQGNFMPIHFHSLAEWRTPLYLYASVPSVAIFGITPLGVRLPAIIFGVLGVLGIYLLAKELLTYNQKPSVKHPRSLLAALLLAISPWHLQYSRAGFEVTMLLTFLMFGVYFFFRSLREKGKYLWLSVTLLTFTPWIYSTAKLFTPLLLIFLIVLYRREILKFSKSILLSSVFIGLLVGLPIAYSTIYGGGAERAGYTSVFTDPTVIPEVGVDRTRDYLMRGDLVAIAKPTVIDRIIHNKFTEWFKVISRNYFQAFSFDFLFVDGDPNPRHSPTGIGQFYKIEVVGLILGILFFFVSKSDLKLKTLVIFWLLAGALPATLTRDGGNHATRLILILPPLIFLISYGILGAYNNIGIWKNVFLTSYILLLTSCFLFYLHTYYVHFPWDSERWWHTGYQESIQTIKAIDHDYDKVIISMSGEPSWTYFAAWYEYDPVKWQNENPIGNDVYVEGFGKVSHTDKFYFGSFNVPGKGIYDLGNYLDSNTLYLAVAKEVGPNLILEPERTPSNLNLIKAIAFPSGEPAYYLFSGID